MKEWWHPKDFTTPSFEMDFREGGAYRYCIRSAKNQVWAHGVYHEIDPPKRLVMTFQWESGDTSHDQPTLITVTFDAGARPGRCSRSARSRSPRRRNGRATLSAGARCWTPSPQSLAGSALRDPLSAFRWVPPFAQGLVRDLRVRWALEEAGLPTRRC